VSRAAVAQAGELEGGAILQDAVDVAEGAPVMHDNTFELGRCSRARSASRCCSDAVESGYFTTCVLPADQGLSPRVLPVLRAYLAAGDVHCGQVIGRCRDTTGIEPFARLVEQQVMTSKPYASGYRVFWIVENGSSHGGQTSIDRMAKAWPTAHRGHTPVPRLLAEPVRDLLLRRPTESGVPERLHRHRTDPRPTHRVRGPQQPNAQPCGWKFTRRDLRDLLQRLEHHGADHPQAAQAPPRKRTAETAKDGDGYRGARGGRRGSRHAAHH